MFERICRWKPLGDAAMLETIPGNEDAPLGSEFVLASDYDALLALYREATICPDCGHKTHYALRCGTGVPDGVPGQRCECLKF